MHFFLQQAWPILAWTQIYVLRYVEVNTNVRTGRPQGINLDDSDVPPLVHSDFQHASNVNVDLVVHSSALCTIISQALRERFGLRVSAARRTDALLQADRDLAEWMISLPTHLCSDMPETPHYIQSALLRIHYYNFLILLHRPGPKLAMSANSISSDDIGASTVSSRISIS